MCPGQQMLDALNDIWRTHVIHHLLAVCMEKMQGKKNLNVERDEQIDVPKARVHGGDLVC